jgi:hypothetical protein
VLHPFRNEAEIVELLRAAAAGAGVKGGEVERAVARSKAVAWNPGGEAANMPSGAWWPTVNQEQRKTVIIEAGVGLVDLWGQSPIRFVDSSSHAEEVIDCLFPGNPWLCCGRSNDAFATRRREQWRGRLAGLQLIVPSPMTGRIGITQDGKVSEHSLNNTGPRRFLVVEADSGNADEQAAILVHLGKTLPLSLVVHSGRKSLHGWYFVAGRSEETLRAFMGRSVALGADRATWTRSQFVRLPGGARDNGNPQAVLFFDPASLNRLRRR